MSVIADAQAVEVKHATQQGYSREPVIELTSIFSVCCVYLFNAIFITLTEG